MKRVNRFFCFLLLSVGMCATAQSYSETANDLPNLSKTELVNNRSKNFFDVNLDELEREIGSLSSKGSAPVKDGSLPVIEDKVIFETATTKVTEKVTVTEEQSISADNSSVVSENKKVTAKKLKETESVKTEKAIKSPSEILNLPALGLYSEKNLTLDREDLKVKNKNSSVSNSSESVSSPSKCTSELPCIPMYNRYIMNLDEDDPTLSKVKTQASKKAENMLISKKVTANDNGVLPEIPLIPSLAVAPVSQNTSFHFKSKKELQSERLAKIETEKLSETDLILKNFREKGIILAVDIPDDLKLKSDTDKALEKITKDLDKADIDELSKRKNKLFKLMGVTGQFMRSYSEAKDKVEFVKNIGLSKVNGLVDSNLKKFLTAYDGVNAQINARIHIDDKSNFRLDPEGKILFPLYSTPKSLTYAQGGLTKGTKSRPIAHLAVGERFYPQAKTMQDLGQHMLGLNFVVDRDLERKHLRGSVGLEYMYNNLKLVTNIYRRLSGWRDSPDFEKGYVEERAASGWDMFIEYWLHSKFALKAGLTHWIGRDISPFGDSNPKKLENSPYIYSIGAKYNPVPALGFEANYQRSGSNKNKEFYLGVNFNLPLGGYELADAFNPDAQNKSAGNMIMTSRTMFIERDYTMPLQYRSKPGMYYIYYVKALGNNRYLFKVEDGFHRPAPNLPVTVKASHPSVKLSNDGNYITDANGNFIVEILHSGVREVTLTVTVGTTTKEFDVIVDRLDWKLKAEPVTIERFETSQVTLYIDSEDINSLVGTEVSWRLGDSIGTLDHADLIVQSDGKAKVTYTPDTTKLEPYDIKVIATVFGVDFDVTIHVVIYGMGADDLSATSTNIDGGAYTTVIYKNLKPKSVVKFTAVGVGKIFAEEPQGTQDMTGTDTNGVSVDVTVDDEGVAKAYVVGSTVVGDTGNILVTTKTQDPYFDNYAPKITIRSNVYDGLWALPSMVQYLEPFDVTLSNLKDGTNVAFSIDNETASFSNLLGSVARVLLASSPNDVNAVKNVTVNSKKASTKYLVTGDYTFTEVRGIHAKYYHDAHNTETDTEASILAIQQYTPYFTIDSENQEKLNWFSGDDEFKVTLTGGQPYRVLTLNNPSANVTITAPEAFDSAGEAEITIKGNDIRSAQAFSVVSQAMGKTQDLSQAVLNGILTYHVYEPVIKTSQGVSGSNITDTALVDGAPAFKGQSDTVDYKTDYEVTFSGLLKGTTVNFSCDNSTLSTSSATVDDNGEVKVTVMGVEDYAIKSETITLSYQVNSVAESRTTKDFTFNLYQYTLSISATNETIVADGTSVVTVTGGRPNEAVEWTLTGSGQYTDKADSFDSTGTATATVQGVSPFTGTVKLNLKQFLSSFINKNITVTRPDHLSYSASVSGQIWNGTATNTIYINMPYVHLLSSVRITGYVDDTGTISINDHVVWNKPYQDETFFDEKFNKTFPISYLKEKNNKIYLIAYNSTHNTDSENGTSAHITLYFTYK